MDIILSKKLGHDITEIIMTDLWKDRFNVVIGHVKELEHYLDRHGHSIYINNDTYLTYQDRYYFESCVFSRNQAGCFRTTVIHRNIWQAKKNSGKIWKK